MPPARSGTHVLRARFLSKSYRSRPVLHDLSLTVRAGETVALSGPSGSGKSTLLHCMAGIVPPDSGEIWFGDNPLHAMSAHERSTLRRQSFGMILPGARLIPELTVIENVALPLLSGRRSRAASIARARHWLDRFELTPLALAKPCQLDARRASLIMLARALVTDPAVLFADEPAANLGTAGSEYLLRVLLSAARSTGTTLILATRDGHTAAHAERYVPLSTGQPGCLPTLV